jgi:hypothetical protein
MNPFTQSDIVCCLFDAVEDEETYISLLVVNKVFLACGSRLGILKRARKRMNYSSKVALVM